MIKELNVTYTVDRVLLEGYIANDQNQKGKRPAVLVVHEWWGLNKYAKMRAGKLAELGHISFPIEYNAEADKNSWNDMKVFFKSLFTE